MTRLPDTDARWVLRRDRRVLTHVAAVTISDIGDQIWLVALTFTAAQVLSPPTAALVIGAATIPRALMMLIGGVIADRLDTRRVMIATDIGRTAVLLTGVACLAVAPTAAVLIGVGILFGLLEAVHDPAAVTFPRQLVADQHLGQVAALRQLGRRAAVIVGAPIGGLVLAAADLAGSMLVDAATFLVLGAAVAIIQPRRVRRRDGAQRVLESLRGTLSYLRGAPAVRDLVLQLSGLNLFVAPVTVVGLALRVTQEGWGAPALGGLLAGSGVGAVIGTLVTLRWQPIRPLRAAQLCLLAQAVALACVGLVPLPGLFLAIGIIGLTAGLASPLLAGAFQATVDETQLGRVSSILHLADDGLAPLAMGAFGLATAATGLAGACVGCGVGMAAIVGTGMRREMVSRDAAARDTTALATRG